MTNDDLYLVLSEISEKLDIISSFVQFFCYGFFVLCVIYFGYWFFSRFFY